MKLPVKKRRISSLAVFMAILLIGGMLIFFQKDNSAAALSGWKAGNIIEDAVMANDNAMSVAQIQSFLNSKVSCDTYGTKPASDHGYPNMTRAQYAKMVGWHAPPYVCLRDYRQNNKSAAQIIYDTSKEFKINPQVFIVLLQKEQGLVTDAWPLSIQYKTATGYGCPDTAPCDSQYFGLTNQLRWAGRMFRSILNASPSWYTPYTVGKNYIQYNPNKSCGGTDVYIENRATQALYNYTPYQPNKGALDAGWGTASCGAYGNRNFFLYFTNWFGSTRGTLEVNGINLESQPFTDSQTTASFTIKNTTKSTMNIGTVAIGVRGPNGENFDFNPIGNISLGAGKSYTYRKTHLLNGPEGTYRFFIVRHDGKDWRMPPFEDFAQDKDGSISYVATKQPKISSALTLSRAQVHKNEDVTATVKIKNNSARSITLGAIAVAGRDANGKNFDYPLSPVITLDAGQEYTYQQTRQFPTTGTYKLFVTSHRKDFGWDENFPVVSQAGQVRSLSVNALDSVTLTSPLSISMPDKRVSNTATATFSIRNHSAYPVDLGVIAPAVRDAKGKNYDFAPSPYITLSPGQTYTYSDSKVISQSGDYKAWIANKRKNYEWSNSYPQSEIPSLSRSTEFSVKDAVTLTEPLKITMGTPTAGNTATATFKIKNSGKSSVAVGKIAAAMRDSKGKNYDFAASDNITLAPGEEYLYSQSRLLSNADTYSAWVAGFRENKWWDENYPASEDPSSIHRKTTVSIKNDLRITSGISLSGTGNSRTATFQIKNYSTKPISLGNIVFAVRNERNTNYDFTPSPYLTIQPGQTYSYSSTKSLPVGSYSGWISSYRNGKGWDNSFPESEYGNLLRSESFTVQ